MFSFRRLIQRVSQPSRPGRRPVRRPRAVPYRPCLEGLEERAVPSVVWNGNGGDAFWSNGGNWSTGTPPGPGDQVIFNGSTTHFGSTVDRAFNIGELAIEASWNGNITVNGNLTVGSGGFTMNSGDFACNAAVSISGTSGWGGGRLFIATGSFQNLGTFNIGGPVLPVAEINQGGTFTNQGTLLQQSTIQLDNGTVLTNASDGTYRIVVDVNVTASNGGTLNNAGTLRKDTTAGTSVISTSFHNTGGVLDIQTGTIQLPTGATFSGVSTINLPTSTLLLPDGVTFSGTTIGTGAGTVSLAGGTLFSGSGGATINFPTGMLQWTGGNIDATAGALTNAATTGFITLNGANDLGLLRTLNNAGTITQTTPGASFNRLNFLNGAILNNTGLYDIQENGQTMRINGGSGQAFNNTGILRKSGPATAGTSDLGNVPFNNGAAATVAVTVAGTLSLSGGGTDTGGSFTVTQSNSTLDLTGGSSPTLTGTYTGTGADTVSLAGGTLNIGSAGATFNFPSGLFQWTGGNIIINVSGSLTNQANTGFLTLNGAADQGLGGTLNNAGTITQTGSRLNFFDSAVLNNTGLYDIQEDGQVMRINGGSGQAFNNTTTGTLRKSTGGGTSTLGNMPFNNATTGTVDVRLGTLALSGGGTDAGGIFTFQNGGVLDLTGGSSGPVLAGSYTGSGTGTVSLASGTLFVGSGGATFNFPSGLFQWTGGNINTGNNTLTNAATFFLTLNGASDLGLVGTLNNAGTLTQTTPGASFNRLNFFDGAVLNNTGLYDIQENGQTMRLFGGSGQAFNNSGTFQKSGPATAGTSDLGNVPFNNAAAGMVAVTVAGTLSLSGGGTDAGGNFTVAQDAILDLTGGSNPTLSGTYTGSGAGTVSLPSGTLNVGSGGATFNFPSSMFQWTGGTISTGSDTLTNADTGFLTLNGTSDLGLSGTLNNAGTITQTTAGANFNRLNFFNGAVLNNAGLYDIQENGETMRINGGSGQAFNNATTGTLRKSGPATAGTATLGNVPLNNPGTVEARSGTLAIGSVTAQVSGNTLTGGAWNVFDTATLTLNGGVALNSNNGNITLSGASPVFTNITNLGANGGSFSLLNGTNFTTTGNLSNTGTLVIGPASILTVTGNFTQTSTGTLDILLGDVPPSGQFGQLVVTGTANLDGTLQIDLVNGYTPNSGDSFTIVTFGARSGDFASLNIPAGGVWDPNAGTVTF
jgi:hypothetical protein